MSIKKVLGLLAGGILLCAMTSCMSYYEKEEIGEALAELIPASMPLNEIYFGEGLALAEDEEVVKRFFDTFNVGELASGYYPVSEDCGYDSIDEIKEDTLKVYSDEYSDYLFTMAFKGISEIFYEGTQMEVKENASYARYIEQSGILTKRVDEDESYFEINRTYDLTDFKVLINRQEYVTAEVQSYVNGEKDDIVEVRLVLEEDGWRLDSPTY